MRNFEKYRLYWVLVIVEVEVVLLLFIGVVFVIVN